MRQLGTLLRTDLVQRLRDKSVIIFAVIVPLALWWALPLVMADPVQAAHLFQNLISNAIKYRVPERPCRIAIQARHLTVPDRWEISVQDNGVGFDQNHARHIWQPFHRLHTQSEYSGSGIGLAICAKIAERHRWDIAATGQPGHGATFKIEVPTAA